MFQSRNKEVSIMKRFICLVVVFTFVFSFSYVSFAQQEKQIVESLVARHIGWLREIEDNSGFLPTLKLPLLEMLTAFQNAENQDRPVGSLGDQDISKEWMAVFQNEEKKSALKEQAEKEKKEIQQILEKESDPIMKNIRGSQIQVLEALINLLN